MNKQPEVTEQTRTNLLEAFWALYAEKRIERITVKEIVAKAGYNRGTFYEYFSDVYQCLERIEARALPSLEELPPLSGGDDSAPVVFASFIQLYREKFKYYDVLLGERGDPSFQRKLIDGIKSAIAGNERVAAEFDAEELDLMLEYVLSGMVGVLRHYYHAKPRGNPAEVMALMHRIVTGDGMDRLRRCF